MEEIVSNRIKSLVDSDVVVLFMKGDRDNPRCGFSARVVQVLDRVLADYATFDVLEDADVRDGIKAFSDWPTIPQLYVKGQFQGGCDVVEEMYENGELHDALGLPKPAEEQPTLEVEQGAEALLLEAQQRYGGDDLHLSIDARFRPKLYFGPPAPAEIGVEAGALRIYIDRDSVPRANGLRFALKDSPQGPMLDLVNPNQPATGGP